MRFVMRYFILTVLFYICFMNVSSYAQTNHIVVSETEAQKAKKTDLLSYQQEWARLTFEEENKEKQQVGFDTLLERVEKTLKEKPSSADMRIWLAKLKMEKASSLGLFKRDDMNKEALALLEQATLINPKALDGYGYALLGHLYNSADVWPFSFGNRVKAKGYLLKALALDPDNLEANYFYGLYLKQYEGLESANPYFKKALEAKQYPDRKTAYLGLRDMIREAMKEEKEEKEDDRRK